MAGVFWLLDAAGGDLRPYVAITFVPFVTVIIGVMGFILDHEAAGWIQTARSQRRIESTTPA